MIKQLFSSNPVANPVRDSSSSKIIASSIATSQSGGLTGAVTKKSLEEKKEVTYSAYATNIENTVKLLTCSKQISLIS